MNRTSLSRRLLQIAVAISSVQALVGGGLYLSRGVAGLSLFTSSPLAIEPSDLYVIPSIEKHSAWFALICLAIFGMGIGRLLSLVHFPPAPGNSLGAMVAELVLPPLLVLWQRSVARAHAAAGSVLKLGGAPQR